MKTPTATTWLIVATLVLGGCALKRRPMLGEPTVATPTPPAAVPAASPATPPLPDSVKNAPPPPPPVPPNITTDYRQGLKPLYNAAVLQVIATSRSDNPYLRANAIEAAQGLPDRVTPMVQLALEDKAPAVRFTALATMGKLRLKDLVPAAQKLVHDPSPSVRAAALFALQRCGQKVSLTPLADMLTSPDPELRANVAMLLGMTGEPSAAPMLKDLADAPMKSSGARAALARIQIAQAIVQLGDDSELDAIRAGAYSQFDEVRVLALQAMGEIGDRRMAKALAQFLAHPPVELQIAAAGAMARMGYPDGLPVVLHAAQSNLDTVRTQAAMALGWFTDPKATAALRHLLNDKTEQVRIAAAAAVIHAWNRLQTADQ